LDLSNNRDHATGKKFTDHLGCLDLKEAVFVTKPLLHVFGHIHGSGGQQVNHIHADGEKTVLVNASIMDEAYQPIHKTITIEL
jgi:Icc-related predicted phosphoesterase